MSGQRSALVKIVAFSMDIRSDGKSSLFQRAIVAPSVSSARQSRPSVMGICGCMHEIWNGRVFREQYILAEGLRARVV